jgi:hypothetical protein
MASRSIPSNRTYLAAMCLALLLLISVRPSSARLLRPTANYDGEVVASRISSAHVDTEVKYAPLLLSMLPRGPVTPSGPSGGTNDTPGN